jgi:hypothetical protein
MPLDKINLSYKEGMLFSRMDLLFEGKIPACTLFSGPYYFAEQLGFRKITDCTFMMATMITGAPDPEDVRKFFRALKRAQRDIDLRPELYTRFYKNEFPKRYHDRMDTRRWGPGERIVFEGSIRGVARLDPRARHLRGQRSRRGRLRQRSGAAGGVAAATSRPRSAARSTGRGSLHR